jgi:hypothetical protein
VKKTPTVDAGKYCHPSAALLHIDSVCTLNAVLMFYDSAILYLILAISRLTYLQPSSYSSLYFTVVFSLPNLLSLPLPLSLTLSLSLCLCLFPLPPLSHRYFMLPLVFLSSGAVYAILFGSETFDSIIGELQGATHVRVRI